MKRKTSIFLTLCLSLICAFCLFACDRKDKSNLACSLVESSETRVVISVSESGQNCNLLDCMEILKQSKDEDFTYTMSNGMITSINGIENPADFSSCWMLYTSDAEMANTSYATEYDGKTLGSAIVGAGELEVVADAIYVWVYTTF